jgi:hypothetical protein
MFGTEARWDKAITCKDTKTGSCHNGGGLRFP